MPAKPSVKNVINLDEDDEEEDEENAAMTAEEAQMRAAQLQKELEEQNKFDCLCDGVNSAMSLVDAAFNELLELKDELLTHGLPPSLLVSLILTTGKMYRSITDLHTPVRELTRLVSVYSVPWEQKSEVLKKLHTDYESKQRQLNIAIRKLQLIDAAARRMEREKIINNWEKVFAKVTSAKTHGRRWKFMIESIKRKIKEGVVFSELEVAEDDDDDDTDAESVEEEDHYEQDEASAKQQFMMSVITASPPQEEEEEESGSQAPGSDIGSEADGIPSEVTDSSGNAAEMSPELHVKAKRHGVSFGVAEEIKEEVLKPEMKDKAVWTNEPEYETVLAVRVYRPLDLKDDSEQDITCSLTVAGKTVKSGILPAPYVKVETIQAAEETSESTDDPAPSKLKAGRRKSIGFSSRPGSPASSSPKTNAKISGILKKTKQSSEDETEELKQESTITDRNAFEEIYLMLPEDVTENIKAMIYHQEKNQMLAMGSISVDDLDLENIPVKYEMAVKQEAATDTEEDDVKDDDKGSDINEENAEENKENDFDGILQTIDPLYIKLQGIKLAIGGHTNQEIGKLPLVCYLIKKEIVKSMNTEMNTESLKELVKDVAGVDIDEVSKEELIQILGREYHDVCTSAMSFASSSSHKSGFIAPEEMEAIREQHDRELQNIQAEYESKFQQLLAEMDQMQRAGVPTMQTAQEVQQITEQSAYFDENQVPTVAKHGDVRFAVDVEKEHLPRVKKSKQPALPDWTAHLPKNVWVRMRMMTEEMIEKRQQLEARVRRQIAVNIEKKLASQYKLQRSSHSVRGPLEDVSLPALFMPSKTGNVYNPRAHMYFHPAGTTGNLRLSQPPSIFQLPPLPEKAKLSVVNLFELSKNFNHHGSTEWLSRIASAPLSKGSRVTTAASRMSRFATPTTPAPTANIAASEN